MAEGVLWWAPIGGREILRQRSIIGQEMEGKSSETMLTRPVFRGHKRELYQSAVNYKV